jgi:cysteine desulfurase/selenocysteine lyase
VGVRECGRRLFIGRPIPAGPPPLHPHIPLPPLSPADLRAHFPHAARMVYLDHAAISPLARPVAGAVEAYLRERSETRPNNSWETMPRLERARERAARLMNAPVERVELAPNTSYALNVLALGYPWQPGDRVAVPACEFPANAHPWLQLRARGVEVDLVPHAQGVVTVEDLEKALAPRTRVVAVSWVQFLSGYRLDLPALAEVVHARGALLAVDAIQGLGGLALDVGAAGVDFLACGGQKWLLGMQGAAVLYLTEALQERLAPVRGYLNGPVDWDDLSSFADTLHPDARRFRVGTLPMAPLVALDAALGLLLDVGPEAVERRVLALARRAAAGADRLGLRRYGPDEVLSGIVTVEHPAPEAAHARLVQENVHLALRDRKLRFSPHAYNTGEEIDAALEAVAGTLAAT